MFKVSQWGCSGVFIVNFEHISYLILAFLLLTLNMKLAAEITQCRVQYENHFTSFSYFAI